MQPCNLATQQSLNIATQQSRNLATQQSRNLATQQSRNLATQQSRNRATQQSRNLATQQSHNFEHLGFLSGGKTSLLPNIMDKSKNSTDQFTSWKPFPLSPATKMPKTSVKKVK
jgi:hypothetical protein